MVNSKKNYREVRFLFLSVLIMLFIGLVLIGDVSPVEAYQNFGDRFYFLKNQALWAGLGLLVLVVFARISYRFWQKISFYLFGASVLLLILVLIPAFGKEVYGARRWLDFGPIGFQPAELVKFALITYFATLFSRIEKRSFSNFIIPVALIGFLVMLEPDLGTTIIIFSLALAIYFVAGSKLHEITLLGIGAILLGGILILTSPYRLNRLSAFINPDLDPLGKSYHIRQIILTLGSGGLFGLGFGKSRQKFQYVPQATTDSILALLGEEFGFVGILIILAVFSFLVFQAFMIAKKSDDLFGKLLATGFSVWLAIQGLLNLASICALAPLTGVPFPFISYGGSSLVSLLGAVGVLINIGKRVKY